ncbi:MAG: aminoacyl-histidine dipeptidase [Ruminococcaceae bacterium]|nr:aminoacyl-histidine dipeptidase [Oscillospiraceae bacterium]
MYYILKYIQKYFIISTVTFNLEDHNMNKLTGLKPHKVFEYFEKLSSIPRGSGDMKKVSEFCVEFSKEHSLKYIHDDSNNVIIYKDATKGYENSPTVILQGHLDMVCQKDEGVDIDFEEDGLDLYIDGEFIKAKGTTLGADNGIAVAYALAILDSEEISHPALEVVFTTDEEIGMCGAMDLDMSKLSGRRMINMDMEGESTITISCAGGSDFGVSIPVVRNKISSKAISISIRGLKGGHSGVEINSGRVNANVLMARILDKVKNYDGFSLINISGGDKGNAIPLMSNADFVVEDTEKAVEEISLYAQLIKDEIAFREPDFKFEITVCGEKEWNVIGEDISRKIVYILLCTPNGVVDMSKEIDNLVETSLNLGILKTEENEITLLHTLRSNKKSALKFMEDKLKTFYECIECTITTGGHYPPWEFKSDSVMQDKYKEVASDILGFEPECVAIHAGLECGVFSSALDGLDCISVGPDMYDIHTTSERLNIESAKRVFDIVCEVLKRCK